MSPIGSRLIIYSYRAAAARTASEGGPCSTSKRRDAGECRDWRKVKTTAWQAANRERWRLFESQRAVAR